MSHRSFIRRVRPYVSHTIFSGSQKWKYFPPWQPATPVEKLIPALDPGIEVQFKPHKVTTMFQKTPDDRLLLIGEHVTKLIKFERIELSPRMMIETQGYTERLITQAIRYGDKHRYTMELATFWLHEKSLVHKLFKVLVPRYYNYTKGFTSLYRLAPRYELAKAEKVDWKERVECRQGPYPSNYGGYLGWTERAVLELKGNPLPPLRIPPPKNANILTNVLLAAAREDTYRQMNLKTGKDEGEASTDSVNHAPEVPPALEDKNPESSSRV